MKLVNVTTGSLVLFILTTGAIIIKSPDKNDEERSEKSVVKSTDENNISLKALPAKSRTRKSFHLR